MRTKIKSWYVYDFKYWLRNKRESLIIWIAFRLPKIIQYWCFIYVYGADGEAPTIEYKEKLDFFVNKFNVKEKL